MSGRYRKVFTQVWSSASFRALSQHAQFLFLFLLTAPQTNSLPGVVRIGVGGLVDQFGWSADDVAERLDELVAQDMAEVDPAGLVWLPNALAYDPPANPNVVRSWDALWREVPSCPLKARIWRHLEAHMIERGGQMADVFRLTCRLPSGTSGRAASSGQEPQKPAAGNGYPNRSGNGLANGSANGYPNQEAGSRKQEQKSQEQQARVTAPAAAAPAYVHASPADEPDEPWITDEELAETSGVQAVVPAAPVTPRCPVSTVPPAERTSPVTVLPPAADLAWPTTPRAPGLAKTSALRAQATSAPAARPAPPPADRSAPSSPEAATILAALAAHPELAELATTRFADSKASLLMGSGYTADDVRAGLADLAAHARSDAALGQPWGLYKLGRAVDGYTRAASQRRRRLSSDGPQVGRGQVAHDEPPPPARRNIRDLMREEAAAAEAAKLAATGTDGAADVPEPEAANDERVRLVRDFLANAFVAAPAPVRGRAAEVSR